MTVGGIRDLRSFFDIGVSTVISIIDDFSSYGVTYRFFFQTHE